LCVSSFEKGQEFLRTCKAIGCRVYLLTVEKLRNGDWPREAIDEMFFMPEDLPLSGLLNAVSYAARTRKLDRIVALDEFDMENVSAIREHLRIPGMGLTTVRYFRDKLAMRARAKESGVNVPEFVHVLNHDELREFMSRVPAPWLLKPRSQASGIGMKRFTSRKSCGLGWTSWATSSRISCWNSLCQATFFTWTAWSAKNRCCLPMFTLTARRRWMCRTPAAYLPPERWSATRKTPRRCE